LKKPLKQAVFEYKPPSKPPNQSNDTRHIAAEIVKWGQDTASPTGPSENGDTKMLTKTQKLFLIVTTAVLITLSLPTFIGYQIVEFAPSQETTVADAQIDIQYTIIDFEADGPVEVSKPVLENCDGYGCDGAITHYENDYLANDVEVSWVGEGPICDSTLCGSVEVARPVVSDVCTSPVCGGDPIRA
jgi:hypothetical protein